MKIDWKSKLSSRKFWAMLAALAISVMTLIGINDLTSEQVAVIITGLGAMCVYMLSESAVDKAKINETSIDGNEENSNDSESDGLS